MGIEDHVSVRDVLLLAVVAFVVFAIVAEIGGQQLRNMLIILLGLGVILLFVRYATAGGVGMGERRVHDHDHEHGDGEDYVAGRRGGKSSMSPTRKTKSPRASKK